ncbi:hypothetical protein DSUL_90001 [Desulfovibrionales bacterium]
MSCPLPQTDNYLHCAVSLDRAGWSHYIVMKDLRKSLPDRDERRGYFFLGFNSPASFEL